MEYNADDVLRIVEVARMFRGEPSFRGKGVQVNLIQYREFNPLPQESLGSLVRLLSCELAQIFPRTASS
jgi:hypothetical protein